MHRILEKQIKQCLGEHVVVTPELKAFFELVSATYTHLDEDRVLLNRSLDISSKEFEENNRRFEKSELKISKQAQNLTLEVADRTKELNKRITELENTRKASANILEDFKNKQQELAKAKLKEDVLIKELEKFKLAVDNVSDNIIITDSEGIVIYANKAVEKVTGYKPEEAVGKKSGTLWKTPMPVEYYQNLWDTIKKQKKVFISEIQNKRKNGEIYTAKISISPILNKAGHVKFFVGIERDITREKEIEKSKTEFVAIASHALRTPLTAIAGLVSMIQDGEYGEINKNLKQPLEDVQTSSERLILLVNDLLNFSRIQTGKMEYKLADFSIADIITQTVHLLHPIVEQNNLQLNITQLEPVIVQGDSDKVKEILNNLIGNASKFTDKGSITVSTKVVGDLVEIQISDTGIGVKKQDQEKLFGLFQQLESSEGRSTGTGLGLHISKQMARKMGGDVRLESSEVGKGSNFVFSIPKSNSEIAKKVKEMIKKEFKNSPYQKSVK